MTAPPRSCAAVTEPPPAWPDLLHRLSAEAASLAILTARIERALSNGGPADRGPQAGGVMQDLQELDRLRQTLEDLGRLMSALAVQAPDAPLDRSALAPALTLRALAGRLFDGEDGLGQPATGESGTLTIL